MAHFKVQWLPFLSVLAVGLRLLGHPAVAPSASSSGVPGEVKTPPPAVSLFLGKPLSYWSSQATQAERSESLDRNADALAQAVIHKGKLYLRHDDLLCCYDVRAYE